MTEPQPVMAQAEQDQLTRQVGRALLTVAGADWQQVRAEYRSAGRHIEVDVVVKGPDGVERPARPPQEVVDGLGRLRQGMYRPGRGTWLSALYVLDPPSAYSAEFEPDVEPRWRRVPPPIGFADELRFFPREDEHIPEWLRQRAGLPPAQDAPATPPSGNPQAGNQPAGAPPAGGPQPSGAPAGGPPAANQPTGGPQHSGQHPTGVPAGNPQHGGPQHGGPQPSGVPAGRPHPGNPSAGGPRPGSWPTGGPGPAPRAPMGGPPTPPPGIPAGPFPAPPAGPVP